MTTDTPNQTESVNTITERIAQGYVNREWKKQYPPNPETPYVSPNSLASRGFKELLRRHAFAELYALRGDWSAKKCAIEAGYPAASAAVTACRLLKRERIKLMIEAYQENPCAEYIVRAPKRNRLAQWRAEFKILKARFYNEEYRKLGPGPRKWVDERSSRSLDRKHKHLGWIDHTAMTIKAERLAKKACDAKYGDIGKLPKKRVTRFSKVEW